MHDNMADDQFYWQTEMHKRAQLEDTLSQRSMTDVVVPEPSISMVQTNQPVCDSINTDGSRCGWPLIQETVGRTDRMRCPVCYAVRAMTHVGFSSSGDHMQQQHLWTGSKRMHQDAGITSAAANNSHYTAAESVYVRQSAQTLLSAENSVQRPDTANVWTPADRSMPTGGDETVSASKQSSTPVPSTGNRRRWAKRASVKNRSLSSVEARAVVQSLQQMLEHGKRLNMSIEELVEAEKLLVTALKGHRTRAHTHVHAMCLYLAKLRVGTHIVSQYWFCARFYAPVDPVTGAFSTMCTVEREVLMCAVNMNHRFQMNLAQMRLEQNQPVDPSMQVREKLMFGWLTFVLQQIIPDTDTRSLLQQRTLSWLQLIKYFWCHGYTRTTIAQQRRAHKIQQNVLQSNERQSNFRFYARDWVEPVVYSIIQSIQPSENLNLSAEDTANLMSQLRLHSIMLVRTDTLRQYATNYINCLADMLYKDQVFDEQQMEDVHAAGIEPRLLLALQTMSKRDSNKSTRVVYDNGRPDTSRSRSSKTTKISSERNKPRASVFAFTSPSVHSKSSAVKIPRTKQRQQPPQTPQASNVSAAAGVALNKLQSVSIHQLRQLALLPERYPVQRVKRVFLEPVAVKIESADMEHDMYQHVAVKQELQVSPRPTIILRKPVRRVKPEPTFSKRPRVMHLE